MLASFFYPTFRSLQRIGIILPDLHVVGNSKSDIARVLLSTTNNVKQLDSQVLRKLMDCLTGI
jgi:hypothetical protein